MLRRLCEFLFVCFFLPTVLGDWCLKFCSVAACGQLKEYSLFCWSPWERWRCSVAPCSACFMRLLQGVSTEMRSSRESECAKGSHRNDELSHGGRRDRKFAFSREKQRRRQFPRRTTRTQAQRNSNSRKRRKANMPVCMLCVCVCVVLHVQQNDQLVASCSRPAGPQYAQVSCGCAKAAGNCLSRTFSCHWHWYYRCHCHCHWV